MTSLPSNTSPHRVELFFAATYQMREQVRWLSEHGFSKFNLVNKNEKDDLVGYAKSIQSIHPHADVCIHYSLKYRRANSRKMQDHANKLHKFLDGLHGGNKAKPPSVLLISGKRPSPSWTTVEALHSLRPSHSPVAVAFNPFLPDPTDRAMEYERLYHKLSSGMVNRVYLQFGIDCSLAAEGLSFIARIHTTIDITASVFLPTQKLLDQQRAHPWYGVFLTESDYLQDTETAFHTTVRLLRLYHSYGVELLVEAPGITTEEELDLWKALLRERGRDENSVPMVSARAQPNLAATDIRTTKKHAQRPGKKKKKSTGKLKKSIGKEIILPPGMEVPKRAGLAIVLFGSHDLRVKSNFALHAAMELYSTILPVVLWEPNQPVWGIRGALQVLVKEAIRNLQTQFSGHSRLKILCRNTDDSVVELFCIAQECDAAAVFWNREMTPAGSKTEERRKQALTAFKSSIHIEEHQSYLTHDIEKVDIISGFQCGHWGTLMPFLKACQKQLGEPRRPIPWEQTKKLMKASKPPRNFPSGCKISELDMAIMPLNTPWDKPIRERFPMTESDAGKRMERFFEFGLPKYETSRSRADWEDATSQLSMYIRLGTLSPHELYWKIKDDATMTWDDKKTFYRRLYWRDLAYYQLYCFPHMRETSVREHYESVQWVTGPEEKRRLKAWQKGHTGYPMVDAGMRELYETGWMNQTVRMIVASFLVEYLRLHWVHGARWFHDTLVDADQAINSMMWQNAGRSGLDQWNFVLSPITASQDPSGNYVRKWLPELRDLPNPVVHQPWKASPDDLRSARLQLGVGYPHRIVTRLQAELAQSAASVLDMRRQHQHRNNPNGYDLITLPNGVETAVFTRRCYRIDQTGKALFDAVPIGGKRQKKNNSEQTAAVGATRQRQTKHSHRES